MLVVSGANNHDWQWTTSSLARILEASGRFDVTVTYEPAKVFADEEERAKYRAFVLDYNEPGWGDAAQEGFLASVRSGTGVVVIHAADNSGVGWPEPSASSVTSGAGAPGTAASTPSTWRSPTAITP